MSAPLLTDPLAPALDRTLDAYQPSLGTTIAAHAEGAFEDLPLALLTRAMGRQVAATGVDPMTGYQAFDPEPPIDAQAANEQFGIPGQLKFDGPTPPSVAEELHDQKRGELAREDILARSPGGVIQGVAGLGTDFAVGALDPLNLAAGFVPAVGEARMSAWLARAGSSTAARVGVRFGAGAINAAVAQAPLTAGSFMLERQEQQDVTAADALLNFAVGTGIGGVAHAALGGLADHSKAADLTRAVDAAPLETRAGAVNAAVGQLADTGEVQNIDTVLDARTASGLPGLPNGSVATVAQDEIPSALQTFRPDELGVDARRFQFKEGGDASGVTERLQGVPTWDPVKAGLVIAYEDADGKRWIVDGHQRLGLAQRLMAADPDTSPQLNGWLYRAADGTTDQEVRAIAAAKNIAEGTGTAIDAAKIFRDAPELAKELPPRSELVRQASALANLEPEGFGMVVNGVVPANYAAIVGRLAPEGAMEQRALLDLLAKTEPANANEAEAIVRQGLAAGHVEARQMGLFGEETIATNLFLDRARVLDRSMRELKRDRALFSTVAREKGRLEAQGNRIAEGNEQRAEHDAQALQLLQTLAGRKGQLSDALTAAAERSRRSGDYRSGARDFVEAIRRSVASGDFDRLAGGGDGGAPQIEPTGATGEGGEPPLKPAENSDPIGKRYFVKSAATKALDARGYKSIGSDLYEKDGRQLRIEIGEHIRYGGRRDIAYTIREAPPKLTEEPDGQAVIPGAEKITDKELAERRMAGALKPEAPQKPADIGLFDETARDQGDMFAKPYASDADTAAAVGRAAEAAPAQPELQAALDEAEQVLAGLKEQGFAAETEPELKTAADAKARADALGRAYDAGANCMTRN